MLIFGLESKDLIALFGIALFVVVIGCITYIVLRNPFQYPYFHYTFDVSRKRNVDITDCIDKFLCDEENWKRVQQHQRYITQWKRTIEKELVTCKLKEYRKKQYIGVLDDDFAYRFQTVRSQTRYVQRNYVKSAYQMAVPDCSLAVSWAWISDRYAQLEKIGFSATLKDYHSKNQRKLMTKALRQTIAVRDNYTCQLCNKYMPDEVGLQIDHVIPIAKGGKTIPGNLRVLCSKCNGKKGSKYY